MLWVGGVLALLATASAFSPDRLSSNAEWEAWKTTYKKEYNSWQEEELRRSIWEKNMLVIQAHNQEYKMGLQSYEQGMNHVGDMTAEEVIAKMTCLKASQTRETENTFTLKEFPDKPPRSIDYREMGWVTPVRKQGTCNSCWAFSAAGALEGQVMKSRGELVSLSPQNLVDCSANYSCKEGGHMNYAYEYMMKNGIDSEKTYPYVDKKQSCAYNESNKIAQIWNYKTFQGNERALRAAVAKYGPVAVEINTILSFHTYKGGVYYDRNCRSDTSNHAVLVVGYGVTWNCQKFWIAKNSWGPGWGEQGYIRIARNRKNVCGIANRPTVPLL